MTILICIALYAQPTDTVPALETCSWHETDLSQLVNACNAYAEECIRDSVGHYAWMNEASLDEIEIVRNEENPSE